MKYLAFCWGLIILAVVWRQTSGAAVDPNKVHPKKCYVNNRWISNGESFFYQFQHSPCIFECLCKVEDKNGKKSAVGTCQHTCPKFSYPYGCEPVSDGCCATSYKCPQGEKCKDEATGMMYGVNDTWALNSTCTCTCLGQGKGIYQCKCQHPSSSKAKLEEDIPKFESPCAYDDAQSCRSCAIGLEKCPVRAKCEKWSYNFENIDLECTCYGNVGTQCISPSTKKRTRRSTGKDRIYIFVREKAVVNKMEPVYSRITV